MEECASIELPAVMTLDAAGLTLFSTPAARQLCEQHELGLNASPGCINPVMRGRLARALLRGSVECAVSVDGIDVLVASCMDAQRGPDRNAPCYMVFLSQRATTRARRTGSLLEPLTPGQRRVANLVGQGLKNKQIAARLCITVRTVESHVHTIFQKLNMTHRAQLVRSTLELGWS